MKKYIIAILFMLSLCGCGSSDTRANAPPVEEASTEPFRITAYFGDAAPETFKSAHPEWNIEVTYIEAYKPAEREKYYQQLSTAIMSGTADDVFILEEDMIRSFGRSNYTYDINEFIKNDPSFKQEDYYMNIIEGFKINDKLAVWPNNLHTIALTALSRDFEDIISPAYFESETVSFVELLSFYEELDETHRVGYYAYEGNIPYNALTLGSYLDYDSNTCDFENPEFVKLLEMGKNAMNPNADLRNSLSYYGSWLESYENNYPYVFSLALLYDSELFLPQKEEYIKAFDNEVNPVFYYGPTGHYSNFKPFANENGELYIYGSELYAVNASSKNLDIAWEYLKFLTTEEALSFRNVHSDPICLNKELNEELIYDNLEYHIKWCISGENWDLSQDKIDSISLTAEHYEDINTTAEFILGICEMPVTFITLEVPQTEDIISDFLDSKINAQQAAQQLQSKFSIYMAE